MIKNTASQRVGAQLITAADGTPFTGSVTVAVTGDAGTQATGSVGSGACTHEGGGYHTYAPAQAETNYDLVAFTFSGTGAVSTTVQIYTRAATPDVNVASIAANAITATSIASDAITDAKVASDVTIASVTGAVGSVTGAVGSVTGAVGSVTGAVGSVTGNVGGNVTGSVGSVATGGITAASFAADAITAAKIAADVTTELQTGLATASALSTVSGLVDDLETRLTATRAGYLDNLSAGAVALEATAQTILTDTADMQPKLGTPAGASISADIAAIEAQTDDIGVAGAGLTAVPWNAAWDAEVQSEATDALNAYDPPTNTEMVAAFTEIKGSTWATTDTIEAIRDRGDAAWTTAAGFSTHSAADVWAVATRVLTANTNLNDPTAAAIADAVWLETLADHSGSAGSTAEALNAAGAAGDPWSTALPGAYGAGSAGKIVGDNINATISSRASQTSVDDLPTNAELATSQASADDATLAAIAALSIPTVGAIADAVLDEALSGHTTAGTLGKAVADIESDATAILADTNELQTDDYPTTLATLATAANLSTLDGKVVTVDSVVDAIVIDTQDIQSRLPAALTGDGNMKADALKFDGTAIVQTAGKLWVLDGSGNAVAAAAALQTVDDELATVDTVVDAIKVSTDKLDDTLEDDAGTYRFTTNALEQAPTGGSAPSASDIADAVLDEAMSGHVTAGTLGKAVADILADTNELQADDYPTTLATLATSAELAKVPKSDGTASWNATALAAINAQADTALADYDAPTRTEATADKDAILDILGTPNITIADDVIDVRGGVDAVETDTQNIQSRIPTSLVSGRMDASVGAMAANTLTASALATDAVSEIQSGLATSTALQTVDDEVATLQTSVNDVPTNAEMATALGDIPTATENADALLNRTISGGADGGRDVTSALRQLRNKQAIATGTLTVYEEDDTTPAWTATVTTAAGDPISAVDPT